MKNVPGADSILKVVLQEENPFEDVSKKFSSVTSSVTGLFGGGDSQTSDTKPKSKFSVFIWFVKIVMIHFL